MVGTTSGTSGQGHFRRRTLLGGVLGAGALTGLAGAGIASGSVSGNGGGVEERWGKVADAFWANFKGNPGEIGAACSVYVGGREVVNLWGGLANRTANRPWRKNTIVRVASTTKGMTAICAHLLVQRGQLDLDAPVVRYWPEFGANGKEHIKVRWLLSHQAGLPIVDGPLTFEQACDWDPVIRALEAQKPLWQPAAPIPHAASVAAARTTAAWADAAVNTNSPRRPRTKPLCSAQHSAAVARPARMVATHATVAAVAVSATSVHSGWPVPPAVTATRVVAVAATAPTG